MSHATAARPPVSFDPSGRRLAWGLLLSVLFHLLVLSLQFGMPGLRAGSGAPAQVTVHLVPPVTAVPALPVPVPAPLPVTDITQPVPGVPAPPAAVPAPVTAPAQPGFTLLDPVVPAPPPAPATVAKPIRRAPRRRARSAPERSGDGLHADVIARASHRDSDFNVPLPSIEPSAETARAEPERPDAPPLPAVAETLPPSDKDEREAERLARQAADDAARQEMQRQQLLARQKADEEAGLHAQREAEQSRQGEAARQRLAEQERMQQAEQERARQLAEQRRQEELARQVERERAAEQQRAQAEREQAAERRRQEELARQQLAEQQHAQQVAEQRRQEELARQAEWERAAEHQRAQQLAEQRRQEELARQAERERAAEQQRAQQLAEQRRQEEVARQQLAEQQRAQAERERGAEQRRQEELARQELAERSARNAVLAGRGGPSVPHSGGGSGPPGAGPGIGGVARGGIGLDLGSRAHDMLRGIDVGKAVPDVLRPANEAQQGGRRALAEAVRREVPLRLYADSVRQKIERNAVLSEGQLRGEGMAGGPVVSVAIRSDGSVEDVAIVRSSGRPDIDDLVRRIVRVNARYSAFPPNVAAHYDVIELRRVWRFAGVLRLMEEVP